MPLTYAQTIAYSRSEAGRAALDQLRDCLGDDPSFGLTPDQSAAALRTIGYTAGAFPTLAAAYYLAAGQNLWPQCSGGQAPGPGAGNQGPTLTPTAPSIFDDPTIWLIAGAVVAVIVLKRLMD